MSIFGPTYTLWVSLTTKSGSDWLANPTPKNIKIQKGSEKANTTAAHSVVITIHNKHANTTTSKEAQALCSAFNSKRNSIECSQIRAQLQ